MQKPQSGWSQFLVPSFVATVLTLAVNGGIAYFSESARQREATRQFNATFTTILTQDILDKTHSLAASGTLQDEQAASVALYALNGLAETESEQRTVLLVAARLLNASPREDTGGPAARFLDVAIKNLEDERRRNTDARQAQDLLDLVHSPGFVDLITAGYALEYFNDILSRDSEIRPTVLGDQMITHESKLALLQAVTPVDKTGWVDVATWTTDLVFGGRNFDYWTASKALMANPSAHHPTMAFGYSDPAAQLAWISGADQPRYIRLQAPRLLRDAPPQIYVVSGTQLAGSLGRVIGAFSASTCVEMLDPARAVLVYVAQPAYVTRDRTQHGRIHLWAHVRAVPDDACTGSSVNR